MEDDVIIIGIREIYMVPALTIVRYGVVSGLRVDITFILCVILHVMVVFYSRVRKRKYAAP